MARTAIVTAALLAAEFELEVGTAIVSVSTRTPAALAIAVADIAALSAGRPVHLGIGAGGQVIVEKWHGVPFAGSVERVGTPSRSFVKRSSPKEQLTSDDSGLPRVFGSVPPAPSQVRIYVGGIGPKCCNSRPRSRTA